MAMAEDDDISTDPSDYSDIEMFAQSHNEITNVSDASVICESVISNNNIKTINHVNMNDNKLINLNVKTWNCVQVKDWLKSKRMSDEIQNKFYNEEIDGEALLYLKENNIDKLIENTDAKIGTKTKLKQYIKLIQNSTHSVNCIFAKHNNIFVNNNSLFPINGMTQSNHGNINMYNYNKTINIKLNDCKPINYDNKNMQMNSNNSINIKKETGYYYNHTVTNNNNNNNSNNNNNIKAEPIINNQFMDLYNKLFENNDIQSLPIKMEKQIKIKKEKKSIKIKKERKSESENKIDTHWRKYYKYKRKTPIRRIKCTVCTDAFTSNAQFRAHMNNIHQIEKPYVCKLCPVSKSMKYANKAGLNTHIMRHHKKIRNCKCTLCDKAFFNNQNLERHQRVHDGKKPFKCNRCNNRFTQKCSLKQHVVTVHLKQKNYQCSYCNKLFGQKQAMKIHMVSMHNDINYTRFQCHVCQKRFYGQREYSKHKHKAHKPKDEIKEMIKMGICPYKKCNKKYNSRHCVESVRYHLVNTHNDRRYANYECKKCEKLFYDKTAFTKHMMKHVNQTDESDESEESSDNDSDSDSDDSESSYSDDSSE